MPKLTKQHASKASEAAGDWRDVGGLLEPGWYLCRLLSVTQETGKQSGQPYWSWKYEEGGSGAWLWDNTSLSEKAIGRLGKVFEAYEVPADTDTDDLIGSLVNVEVGVYTIPQGARSGQLANNIRSLAPGHTHPDFESYAQDDKPDPGEFTKRGRAPKDPVYGDEEPF